MLIASPFSWIIQMHVPLFLVTFLLIGASSDWLPDPGNMTEHPTANLSSSWVSNFSATPMITDTKAMRLQPILATSAKSSSQSSHWFWCGFYCNRTSNECLFGVMIFPRYGNIFHSEVVWSANRNNPVEQGAELSLAASGDLSLKDQNGTLVWSTKTGGKSVSGLNLTNTGNLVLFDTSNAIIWRSFDHPTDSLLPGQMLFSGQKLISNASQINWSEGLYSLSFRGSQLVASMEVGVNATLDYYESGASSFNISTDAEGRAYAFFDDLRLGEAQFVRMEADGHLKIYGWEGEDWVEVMDLLTRFIENCGYPLVCGQYGICSAGQCSCPNNNNIKQERKSASCFKEISERQPNLGCLPINNISCSYPQFHSLVELQNVSFISLSSTSLSTNTDLKTCKKNCLQSCKCKAAVFQYSPLDDANGTCYVLSQVFSFKDAGQDNTTIAYIKVQNPPTGNSNSMKLGVSLGTTIGVFLILSICLYFFHRKRNQSKQVDEAGYLNQLPGTLTRFSYDHLRVMTENFSKKLGEGGFGSVFLGTLRDGMKVAVKRLNNLDLAEKTFLAEVETIGSIHHVNLVRLIGFCAESSHRLLVYEYLRNGSLNRWIFPKHQAVSLKWQSRRKIILDIAKGLAYLHEGCRQKIFHLDIKPQNILLDDKFNAKLCDFGLSKLIEKDQSKVVTTIKGTPGYMAPEWLSSFITEKVDVYSFGIVVLEILCGRRNLDPTEPEEEKHLLGLFKAKVEGEELWDMVEKKSEDMQAHVAEAVEILKVAACCLQNDFQRRPSMAVVVQLLEGLHQSCQGNLEYNLTNPPMMPPTTELALAVPVESPDGDKGGVGATTLLSPSVLSGPR
ncbi:Non-specific serine/threonine protein kinase [Bertholletia excelsa]